LAINKQQLIKTMPQFSYKAKEGPGKIVDGVIEASNNEGAINEIIRSGLVPLEVVPAELNTGSKTEKSVKKESLRLIRQVSLKDLTVFTRQISDLVDASVPMLRSLQITSSQTRSPHFKQVIDEMHASVKDGSAFSDALARHKQVFSSLFINMVKAGEVSGNLEKVLRRLADYLEKEQETRSKVKSSLAYPMLILVVGIVTVFVLLTFVIPRLSVIFDDLDQALPLPTVILTGISGFFAQYWWFILAVVGIGAVYLKKWVNTPGGRKKFDAFKLRIPLLGDFISIVEIGRFSRTLGTLVESGVAITTALNSVWATIENVILMDEVKKISEDVANGTSLKAALKGCTFFPEMAVNMISVGEETGHLERGLYKIADTYEKQADQTVKAMLSLLGPVVLIVIVAIVGFVVIAMLLPIFKMNLLIE